ncbi:hypothetical protein JCM10908_003213 [Rhodotorula pacifica]|uniref:uncharacterized protein n=1 Tax=Rhodotorula pacifica TaxID=1495444 RepID=UPI00316D397B
MADAFEPLLAAASNTTSAITGPILEELGNEVDLATCRLLGPFALAIQGIMGAAVLGSLVVKRMREKPRRKWKIWLADVSKQVIGQAFVHASNVAISDLIAMHTSDNPCSLYALNIITDTTLGVLILYWLLHFATLLMRRYAQPLYETGYYGSPFSLSLWGEQAAVYVACLTAMKVVVLGLFWLFPFLEDIMSWTLSWITNYEAQVFVVMLVIPLIMNLFQFLMIDSFLKSKDPHSPVIGADTDEEAQRRGFLEDEGEEEGDESVDERQMREIRRKADSDDGGAGLHRLGDDDDDDEHDGDDDDDNKYRKKRGARPARTKAVDLFDADLEAGGSADDVPDLPLALNPHSYPPHHTTRPTSSVASTIPPPYSARNAQTSEGEDGWDEEWSGSETTRSRPASPTLATSTPPLVPSIPSPSPPVLPRAEAPSPRPATSVGIDKASSSTLTADGAPEDEWGFGEEDGSGMTPVPAQTTTSTPPALDSAPPSPPALVAPAIFPPAASAPANLSALHAAPASLAYTPSPAPLADDWGLDLDESENVEEDRAEREESVTASGTLASATVGGEEHVRIEGAPAAVAESQDAAGNTSEDEWGFHDEHDDHPPDGSADPASEPVRKHLDSDPKGSTAAPLPQAMPALPDTMSANDEHLDASGEDDLDDWGFQDSPSLTQDVNGQENLKVDWSRIAQARSGEVERSVESYGDSLL